MKKLLTLFIFCLSFTAYAQEKELDSLYAVLKNHPQKDTSRFRLLITISDYLLSNPEESKNYIEQALELATELEFKKGVSEAYCSLAYYFFDRLDLAQAVEHGLTALRGYESINHLKGIYGAYELLTGLYVKWNDVEKSEEYLGKMIAFVNQHENLVDLGDFYYNVAFLKLQQKKFEEGFDFATKSLAIRKGHNDLYDQAICYFLLAKAQQGFGKIDDALRQYQNMIRLTKLSNHPYATANIASAHEGIGDIYIQQKGYDRALLHLDTALQAARKVNSSNMIIKIFRDRALAYEAIGNLPEALKYERLNKKLSDSLFNIEKAQQMAEAQTRYETEKKEQTIQLLSKDKKIQTLQRNILFTGLILVVIIAATVYGLQRYREKKNLDFLNIQIDLLTSQHQQLSEKYKQAITGKDEQLVESADQRLLRNALEIVEKNISDPFFGVEKMAEDIAMSRTNLHRKLKAVTGFSPSDFIRNVRLKRAANLLRNNADSVAQIGFSVGFEDQSYFSKSFKKQFGIPPSEYSRTTAN